MSKGGRSQTINRSMEEPRFPGPDVVPRPRRSSLSVRRRSSSSLSVSACSNSSTVSSYPAVPSAQVLSCWHLGPDQSYEDYEVDKSLGPRFYSRSAGLGPQELQMEKLKSKGRNSDDVAGSSSGNLHRGQVGADAQESRAAGPVGLSDPCDYSQVHDLQRRPSLAPDPSTCNFDLGWARTSTKFCP
jgi:hypothetical protein